LRESVMDEGKQQRERERKRERERERGDNQEVRVLALWATGVLVVTPE
jgi:hypothetical protein